MSNASYKHYHLEEILFVYTMGNPGVVIQKHIFQCYALKQNEFISSEQP